MKNIAVVFGGKSAEHDISVITGVLTLNTLAKNCNAIAIYIDKDGIWWTGKDLNKLSAYKNFTVKGKNKVCLIPPNQYLFCIKGKRCYPKQKIDAIINCCHGLNGEDGTVSAIAQLCEIAFCSPDIFCSSFAIDKARTKVVLKGLNIPTLNYKVAYKRNMLENFDKTELECQKLGYPVIIKPANLGSSIGIERANNSCELLAGFKRAFTYDTKVIVEPMLTNFTEINCACYMGKEVVVSDCEKPIASGDILSFTDKYSGMGSREFPANISKELSQKIKFYTKKIYKELGFDGIIRIDYLICNDKVFLNEINTVPGSLAYYLFAPTIDKYNKILNELIDNAIKKTEYFKQNRFKFTSSVLLKAGNIKK